METRKDDNPQCWTQIITIGNSNYALSKSGRVAAWGKNPYGKLGLGVANQEQNTPKWIKGFTTIKQIYTGNTPFSPTFFLSNDGTVFACGNNYKGSMGMGHEQSDKEFFVPTQIERLSDITNIFTALGGSTFFLDKSGNVFSCGSNSYGQLGLGNRSNQYTPKRIESLNNEVVEQIVCDEKSTYFLTSSNTVYSCGGNEFGQLGLGDNRDRSIPTKIERLNDIKQVLTTFNIVFLLRNNGELYGCGYNSKQNHINTPLQIQLNFAVKEIHEARIGVLLLMADDNKIYRFGSYKDNFTKTPILEVNGLRNVKKTISTGHSQFYLLQDGKVFIEGLNSAGHLGLRKILEDLPPITDISSDGHGTYLLTENGKVLWCSNCFYAPSELLTLNQLANEGEMLSNHSPTLFNATGIETTTTTTIHPQFSYSRK